MNETKQFCTFHLDRALFGVEVRQVQEVIRSQPMTRVPLSPDAVKGLINLRGQIVTAIDLRERFGLPAAGDGVDSVNVIVRVGEGAVSLLVDEIGDVIEVGADQFEPPPGNLRDEVMELITGVYKTSSRLLHVLDIEKNLKLIPAALG